MELSTKWLSTRGSKIPLGQIPFGSGNDCCTTHGIPRKNLNAALDILVDGVDRSWCLAIGRCSCSNVGWLSITPSNHWDGEPIEEGRTVRWVFLESDAGITSAISRANYVEQNGLRVQKVHLSWCHHHSILAKKEGRVDLG